MALKVEEYKVQNNKGDYLKAKHIRLFGTNDEIGYKLGELAKDKHKIQRQKWSSKVTRNSQYKYLKQNYPAHYARMRGYANAYGDEINSTEFDYTNFGVTLNSSACSAVYYPPQNTETGSGIISRNADLPLVSLVELFSEDKTRKDSVESKLYIIELHPDHGYASLITFSFELYGSALDGINSEGLSVVHLHADTGKSHLYNPGKESTVGINEMLVVQLLLDTCKNIDEAKEVILCNKHFRMLLPIHLLIADKQGRSFVWEYPIEHNKDYFINGVSKNQIVTNFPLYQYPGVENFPPSKDRSCPFARYKVLDNTITEFSGRITLNDIKKINSKVFVSDEMFDEKPPIPVRTVYHNIYDINNRTMEISFYRKEVKNKQLRTKYFKFELKPE